MKGNFSRRATEEAGATMVEYVLALALLLVSLLAVNDLLLNAAQERAEKSADVVGNMAPCGHALDVDSGSCY